MSTQKWESVTWDWLEREIVDCLLTAGKRRNDPGSLARLLREWYNSQSNSPTPARKQIRGRSNG
jgi:hypothetical protein